MRKLNLRWRAKVVQVKPHFSISSPESSSPDAGAIHFGRHGCRNALSEAQRDRLRADEARLHFSDLQSAPRLHLPGKCFARHVVRRGRGPGRLRSKLLRRVGLEDQVAPSARGSCPPASNSASPWPARWRTNRSSSWRTNPPAISITKCARESLALIRDTCRENGAALLFVSHAREVLGQFEHVGDFHETEPRPRSRRWRDESLFTIVRRSLRQHALSTVCHGGVGGVGGRRC
jgi:hypothetical protein